MCVQKNCQENMLCGVPVIGNISRQGLDHVRLSTNADDEQKTGRDIEGIGMPRVHSPAVHSKPIFITASGPALRQRFQPSAAGCGFRRQCPFPESCGW